jgi:G3E family GTPase
VIEASGVADPRVIRTLLHDSGLDDHFALQRIVAVTDPHSLPRLWQTLPNIKAQVSAAGDVLINKTDLFPIQSVEEAERLIREANPSAALHRTIRCELTINLFEPLATPDVEGDYARCADPNYHRIALQIDRPVHLARLCRQLEDLADGLYRAKGILPTDDGFVRLDNASGTISIEPHPADRNNRESGRFILIVNPDQRHEAESIARELAESHAIISA